MSSIQHLLNNLEPTNAGRAHRLKVEHDEGGRRFVFQSHIVFLTLTNPTVDSFRSLILHNLSMSESAICSKRTNAQPHLPNGWPRGTGHRVIEGRKLQILLIRIPRRCAMPQRPPVTAGGGDEAILPISPRRYTVQYVSDRRYSTYVGER